MLLALARRHAAGGRTSAAVDAYRRAEAGFAGRALAETCRDERMTLQSWVMPESTHPREDHWLSRLRAVVESGFEPQPEARDPTDAGARDTLIEAVALLVAGRLPDAHERAVAVTAEPDATAALAAAGATVAGIATLVQGNPMGLVELRRAEDQAERGGVGWISRMARAARSIGAFGDPPAAAAAIRDECLDDGDRWGAALATLFEGAGLLERADGAAGAVLSEAAERFHELRAGRLQRLARDLESSAWIPRGVAA